MATRVPILFGIDVMARGGTELQLAGLIERLDRTRFEPHLLTLREQDPASVPADCQHLPLLVSSLADPRSALALGRLVAYLRRRGIAIVQTFFQDATIFGMAAARIAGVPIRLVSFRDLGFWRTPAQDRGMRMACRSATGFVANSVAVRDEFRAAYDLDPDRFAVIANGIDTSRFSCRLPDDPPRVVGLLGNLNRAVKRADLFVEAAGILAARYPEVRWEIVGEGHLRSGLAARAATLGLADRLTFRGSVRDVAALLPTWDIGVLCSDSEGFANALLEYMLSGCAVVATDVGGNRETIRQGVTGVLVPCGDARGLAAGIEELLGGGARSRRLAAEAHAEALRRYSWDRCVQSHHEMYDGLLAMRGDRVARKVRSART